MWFHARTKAHSRVYRYVAKLHALADAFSKKTSFDVELESFNTCWWLSDKREKGGNKDTSLVIGIARGFLQRRRERSWRWSAKARHVFFRDNVTLLYMYNVNTRRPGGREGRGGGANCVRTKERNKWTDKFLSLRCRERKRDETPTNLTVVRKKPSNYVNAIVRKIHICRSERSYRPACIHRYTYIDTQDTYARAYVYINYLYIFLWTWWGNNA